MSVCRRFLSPVRFCFPETTLRQALASVRTPEEKKVEKKVEVKKDGGEKSAKKAKRYTPAAEEEVGGWWFGRRVDEVATCGIEPISGTSVCTETNAA